MIVAREKADGIIDLLERLAPVADHFVVAALEYDIRFCARIVAQPALGRDRSHSGVRGSA